MTRGEVPHLHPDLASLCGTAAADIVARHADSRGIDSLVVGLDTLLCLGRFDLFLTSYSA